MPGGGPMSITPGVEKKGLEAAESAGLSIAEDTWPELARERIVDVVSGPAMVDVEGGLRK